MQTQTFKIRNMACQNCRKTIETTLVNLTGVQEVDIDFPNKLTKVTYNDEQIKIQEMVAAVADKGYQLVI